ncbi:MAG: hypothetical protein A2X08_16905 [Bacteroidetes bacterium GWA2_32_17]|nr:MAG: hypothetical protein A2X08_16905 [Bacteroidetes bacterium GWA2_32_17]
MTLNLEVRNELIKYRMQQASECIDEVLFLIDNKKYKIAINRIYYGMFYSLLALGLKDQYESSKHSQLIGWFNKNYIHTNLIDVKYGKMINKSFTLRNESDYEPFTEYEEQEVKELYDKMKEFIKTVHEILL